MTRDAVAGLCQAWLAAMDARDLDALGTLYTDDAVLESPMAGSVHGRETVLHAARTLFDALAAEKFEAEPALIDGTRAVLITQVSGAHTGAFMGLSPTGRSFRIRVVFVFDLRDGQIARERRIYDFTGLLVQVGVLKAKPR